MNIRSCIQYLAPQKVKQETAYSSKVKRRVSGWGTQYDAQALGKKDESI